ncbi:lysophospholipid acyltransferase family protein [Crenalkalicoccus roseus]|uniref:lysophospholipid acyltransferase family protein n=1 Tax=Crenalkalicoccus roseus TaxID=1485588 RepID=UPI001080CFCF|nr:lysophospholipid acyltransferase family protein [Crenalkalicoccus roseus]
MLRRLIRHPRAQAALARLLGLYLATVLRTTRWTLLGQEHLRAALSPPGQGAILAFWHERLALMAPAWQVARETEPPLRGRRAHVLVSRHRDGRLIGAVGGRFALCMVHASSSRGGAAGLRAMLRLLAAGECVVITPDGPRGPARRAAPGVAQLAALSGRPVLACAAATTRHRRLGSWDRMLLPLPFGRGVIVAEPPLAVPREAPEAALPAIEAALTAACDRADSWGPGR